MRWTFTLKRLKLEQLLFFKADNLYKGNCSDEVHTGICLWVTIQYYYPEDISKDFPEILNIISRRS